MIYVFNVRLIQRNMNATIDAWTNINNFLRLVNVKKNILFTYDFCVDSLLFFMITRYVSDRCM